MEKSIQELSQELKSYIKKYDHQSFVSHWSYYSNAHIRTGQSLKDLPSPVRQVMYLMSPDSSENPFVTGFGTKDCSE